MSVRAVVVRFSLFRVNIDSPTPDRHVRTKQEPCQPIPLFEELVALIMRVSSGRFVTFLSDTQLTGSPSFALFVHCIVMRRDDQPENRHVILNVSPSLFPRTRPPSNTDRPRLGHNRNHTTETQIDVKITSDPHVLFPLIARELDSYSSRSPSTSSSASLNSRIILGLWHPLFLPPALTHLPHVKRYHIGLSPQIAVKYFWEHCHGFSMNVSLLATPAGEAFLTKCEREGKEVFMWTVNDEPGLRRCRERGVGVITDRVGWAVRVREEVSCRWRGSDAGGVGGRLTWGSSFWSFFFITHLSRLGQWEKDPSLIPLSRWEHFRWSWFNWRHYAIPQVSVVASLVASLVRVWHRGGRREGERERRDPKAKRPERPLLGLGFWGRWDEGSSTELYWGWRGCDETIVRLGPVANPFSIPCFIPRRASRHPTHPLIILLSHTLALRPPRTTLPARIARPHRSRSTDHRSLRPGDLPPLGGR